MRFQPARRPGGEFGLNNELPLDGGTGTFKAERSVTLAEAWIAIDDTATTFSVLVCDFLSLGRQNSYHHKMWMRIFPCKCPLPAVEKAVDDDRVSLNRSAA